MGCPIFNIICLCMTLALSDHDGPKVFHLTHVKPFIPKSTPNRPCLPLWPPHHSTTTPTHSAQLCAVSVCTNGLQAYPSIRKQPLLCLSVLFAFRTSERRYCWSSRQTISPLTMPRLILQPLHPVHFQRGDFSEETVSYTRYKTMKPRL